MAARMRPPPVDESQRPVAATPVRPGPVALLALTTVALAAFAANSLLARAALTAPEIDPFGYTVVRLGAGAAVLAALVRLRPAGTTSATGDWTGAAALFGYALAFSVAYRLLGAATGALILFASVQCTMVAAGVARGERPGARQAVGMTVAFAAFVGLVLPGLRAPDPVGTGLMALSGIAWGVYSLKGRGSSDPTSETAGNFLRSLVFCVPLVALALMRDWPTWRGLVLAGTSGALASGLGYAVWYGVLPRLGTLRAAVVQLAVPVVAAVGAVVLLGEDPSLRLAVCGALILAGVALATLGPRRR